MRDENAKDGALLPWGAVREQFLDAVTLEVAGNAALSFSALSRSCSGVGAFCFIRTRVYLKIKTQGCIFEENFRKGPLLLQVCVPALDTGKETNCIMIKSFLSIKAPNSS